MFHQRFSLEIPSWETIIRADFRESETTRLFHFTLRDTPVKTNTPIRLTDRSMLLEEIDTIDFSIQREYEPPPQFEVLGKTEPDPFMEPADGSPPALGTVSSFEDFLVVRLYVGHSIFDELWQRHIFGGPMPPRIAFDVQGFHDGGAGGEVIWDQTKFHSRPITNLEFGIALPATGSP